MNIDDFAGMTYRIISNIGFDDLLPTLCLPGRREIATLDQIPEDEQVDIRSISLDWARSKVSPGEEFLLVYREDASSFRIIRCVNEEMEEKVFLVDSDGS